MTVHYHRYGKVRVSGRWNTVLRAARKDVRFRINSGHRTLRQQFGLFHQNMRLTRKGWVQRPGRPLTAVPTPFAPHIRTGRPDHALDVDQFFGDGVDGLVHWLRVRKAHVSFPVRGEGWHIEIDPRDLERLWKEYR